MSNERPKPTFCGLPNGRRTPTEAASDAEIPVLVESLFQTADRVAQDRLIQAGDRAVPFVVAALDDLRTEGTIFPTPYLPGSASPFASLCRILQELNPPSAAVPLTRFTGDRNKEFRKNAALTLGSIATVDCLSGVARALQDEDEYVRSSALIGMNRAIQALRGEPAFLEQVFPKIVEALDLEDLDGKGPKLLNRIDRNRAIPLLLARVSLENPQMRQSLEALNDIAAPVPRKTIVSLIAQLEPLAAGHPHGYELGQLLVAYALNPDGDTEPKLRTHLSSPVEEVARQAGAALMILHGLEKLRTELYDILVGQGFDALSEPQKVYAAVTIYDNEVRNGGHVQYFGNSSADSWHEAIQGLRLIQAQQKADILEQALRVFGPDGPPEDSHTRRDIAHEFPDADYDLLRDLDQRYYDDAGNVAALLSAYAVDQRDAFRRTM